MKLLVLGGSGSGKSEYAEQRALEYGELPRYYLATMEPFGEEGEKRILRHKEMRAEKGFSTCERYTGLAELDLPEQGVVLLECVGNLVANEMFSPNGVGEKEAAQGVIKGINKIAKESQHIIVVSNDVFSDGVTYPEETQNYLEAVNEVNKKIAAGFDEVIEVVCGIPVWYKKDGRKPWRGAGI